MNWFAPTDSSIECQNSWNAPMVDFGWLSVASMTSLPAELAPRDGMCGSACSAASLTFAPSFVKARIDTQ